METLSNLPNLNLPNKEARFFRSGVISEDRPFWFVEGNDLRKIQKDYSYGKHTFGSVYKETLGSDVNIKLNEDALMELPLGRGRTLYAVLDGASSQKKNEMLGAAGMTGAFYISHMVAMGFDMTDNYEYLRQVPDLTAEKVVIYLNRWIYTRLKSIPGIDYSDITTVPGMAAAFLLMDVPKRKVTIAQVADTMVSVIDKGGSVRIITPNKNDCFDRETQEYAVSLAEKYDTDLAHIRQIPEAKELIHRQLVDSFERKTNTKGGCGIMNGMPELISNDLIYTAEMPMDGDISSIMMYSDGAILPYAGRGVSPETSVRNLAGVIEDGNDGSALQFGASILEQDANHIKVPRLKRRDDSTVIKFNFF